MELCKKINDNLISSYIESLKNMDKPYNTIKKYDRDLRKFRDYLKRVVPDCSDTNEDILSDYQKWLIAEGFSYRSVNSYVSIAYQLCLYLDIDVNPVKALRPEVVILDGGTNLTKAEYQKLVKTALKYNMEKTGMMIQAISGTPLKYEEMKLLTVEAISESEVIEFERNGIKMVVHLQEQLVKALREYIKANDIKSGYLFATSSGKFISRAHFYRDLQRLCRFADVDPDKVSFTKIRKSFANDYYSVGGYKIK